MSAGWGFKRVGELEMCCGRGGNTPSPARVSAAQLQSPTVGDRGVSTIRWMWTSFSGDFDKESELLQDAQVVSGTEVLFASEEGIRNWIAAGNPGTKKPIAV